MTAPSSMARALEECGEFGTVAQAEGDARERDFAASCTNPSVNRAMIATRSVTDGWNEEFTVLAELDAI